MIVLAALLDTLDLSEGALSSRCAQHPQVRPIVINSHVSINEIHTPANNNKYHSRGVINTQIQGDHYFIILFIFKFILMIFTTCEFFVKYGFYKKI